MGLTYSPDLSRLKRDLASLADFDGRALNDKIGESIESSTRKRFEDETAPDGTKWPASYRVRTKGGQTLSENAHLKNSFDHQATATSVEVGTNLKCAHVHQFGMEIKAKNAKALRFRAGGVWIQKKQVTIPARPFLGINDDDMEEIDRTILKHIKGR